MTQRVQAVDIEGDLIGWLPGALAAEGWTPVTVSDQLGAANCVAVYRVGGVMAHLVLDQPTIQFDCKGATNTRSAQLALLVRSLVFALRGYTVNGHAVNDVQEVGGLTLDQIPDSPTRYAFSVSMNVSATIIG